MIDMIFFLWFTKLILHYYEPVAVASVSHVYVSKWCVVAFQVRVCNRSTEEIQRTISEHKNNMGPLGLS